MTAQLVKRLATRTIFGSKADIQKLVLDDQKNNIHLYRIFGQATGYVSGKSKFQNPDGSDQADWIGIAGDFEAMNAVTGECFQGVIAFLPTYIVQPIVEAVKNPEIDAVNIAFDVFAQYDSTSATSYIYLARPVKQAGEKTVVDTMREALPPMTVQKALADHSERK